MFHTPLLGVRWINWLGAVAFLFAGRDTPARLPATHDFRRTGRWALFPDSPADTSNRTDGRSRPCPCTPIRNLVDVAGGHM